MRNLILLIVAVTLVSLSAVAQKTSSTSALKEMVETEQAFSKTAEEKNTRDAFMAFIADDGLLFRPSAVNGKKWMNEHPVPASEKHPLLAWQPAFAGMAEAGDLGFTTGPWEFKADIKDEKPVGYGHFVTMWKKQSDGTWKFVVDLGISHPMSGGPLTIWKVEDKIKTSPGKTVEVVKATSELIENDRAYALAAKEGLVGAFQKTASSDARLYLPEKLPFIGRDAAVTALTTRAGVRYQPSGGDVSRSGDLGYTHGTYEKVNSEDPTKVVEHGSYLRIWKNQGGSWRIVLDVTNPA